MEEEQIQTNSVHWLSKLKHNVSLARVCGHMLFPRVGILEQHPPRPLHIPRYYLNNSRAIVNKLKISIVTPSLNQAEFIGRTIQSVLDQGYSNLEYIVQDGDSKDGSLDIIKSFQKKLAYFESRKDNGQAQAINIGFQRTTGEIMAYVNSDDIFLPGALSYVANYFSSHPTVDVVYGHRVIINEKDEEIGRWVLPAHDKEVIFWADYIPQETLFWRRNLWEKIGSMLDESYHFAMDWELLVRFHAAGAKFERLPRFLAAFRVHPTQKTSTPLNPNASREVTRLLKQIHGVEVSSRKIYRMSRSYLSHSMINHKIYQLGIFRY